LTRAFIVLGDATSHGGRVITADYTTIMNGKPLACVGHLTVCPKCKGTFPISSGADDMVSMGAAPARHGDKTACGATLIASQQFTTWSNESDMGSPAAAVQADALSLTQSVARPAAGGICLECLAKAAMAGAGLVVR
jgi:uncharacterized Zn-binding protein involved in type VI secretion